MHPARSTPLHSGEEVAAALGHQTAHFADGPARRAERVASVGLDVDLGMTAIDTAITQRHGATAARIALTAQAPPSCDDGVPAQNAGEMA